MKYTLFISASPYSPGAHNAYHFINALLKSEHALEQVFFYGDATAVANSNLTPAQNESNPHEDWVALIDTHNLNATVCIAAALKRGYLDKEEQARYEKTSFCVKPPFTLGGLGQLVEATATSDRVVSFT